MPSTNPAAQRKRSLKKRKAATAIVSIESPRSQLRRNQEVAASRIAENRVHEERRKEKQIADVQAKLERQDALREGQKAALLSDTNLLTDESLVNEAKNVPKRVIRASASPGSRCPLPSAEYVDEVTFESLCLPFNDCECSDFGEVLTFVKAQREVAVLCALPDGNGVRTWNDLSALEADDEAAPWHSPSHWTTLTRSWTGNTAPWLRRLSGTGNYNDVLFLTPDAPVDDPTQWPPQLRKSSPLTPAGLCRNGEYVVRMTRTDPFREKPAKKGCKTPPRIYRSMKIEALAAEMALTLHAASLGIGPAVYAAVSWPWDREPGEKAQRYGLLMVLERAAGDMVDYQDELLAKHPPCGSIKGPSAQLRERAEFAGAWLAGLCYQVAWSGFINFDMKPANLLMCERQDTFCMTDFDHMYHRSVPDAEGGVKARFFVNLLLLCTHVRAYSSRSFTASFVKPLAPELLRLWKEAVTSPETFGPGSAWLRTASTATTPESGAFNHHVLSNIKDPGQRLATMLSMMVYEYFFDDQPPKRRPRVAAEWSGWTQPSGFFSGPPPLVQQLLRFVLFHSTPVPDDYSTLLGV